MGPIEVDNLDMASFIKYPKLYLYVLGIWPIKNFNWFSYWIYRLRSLILVDFMIYSCVIGTSVGFYFAINSLEKVFQSGFMFVFAWSACIKYFNYTYKREEILQILKDLDNSIFVPMFQTQNKFIQKWSKFAQNYCKGYATCVYIGGIFFMIFPVLDTSTSRKYPIDMWFPFDASESKIYFAFTYVVDFMGVAIIGALNVSLDTLFCVLMNVGTSQIQILKDTLENAIKYACYEENDDLRKRERSDENRVRVLIPEQEANLIVILNRCIDLHNALNKLFSDMESIFSPGVFSQLLANTLVLCMNVVQIHMVPIESFQFLTLVEFSGDIMIESSLYCFNGQFVATESATIIDSIYKMEWYRSSTKIRRMLFIMLEKAKSPYIVKAGGIFDLSVTTLLSILRSTFSFYTVMSTFFDRFIHEE